jgi:SOS-response transcriptional repressor LexA
MLEHRPSKKQRELLSFIDGFIKGNGYGPSYREIMRALDYRSVSTVAVHVDGLIVRGLLRKTDNSARSLEVIRSAEAASPSAANHRAWLQKEIHARESALATAENDMVRRELATLIEVAKIFGIEAGSTSEIEGDAR